MREIKFRAWDKKLKRMCQCHTVELVDDVEGRPGVYVEKNKDTVRWLDAGTYELMQFTGLKDKNGKEIYEGDIVTLNGYQPKEVKWVNCRSYTGFNIGGTQKGKKEVIGNIYENPDLIRKEKE